MTAQTPLYGIKYIVRGEPIRNTRQALQDNAETIEAALVRGGVVPPGAADLTAEAATRAAADTANANAIAALQPGAWQSSGLTPPAGYAAVRYRKIPSTDSVWIVGTVTGNFALNAVIFTLAAGFRPTAGTYPINAQAGTNVSAQVDIKTDGTVTAKVATTGGFVQFDHMVPLS